MYIGHALGDGDVCVGWGELGGYIYTGHGFYRTCKRT